MFGLGWRSTYEERLIVGSGVLTNYMVYARADGSFWIFGTSNGTAYTVGAPANINAGLAQSGTQWVLTFQNGDKRIFSSSNGSLLSIVDRNGNTTQLTYDGLNRLIGVADAAGRHLNFTYVNGTSSSPVAAATSDVGLSLSYAYDTQGRLTTVTRPDLSTYNFAYNAQSLINAVTDAQGKVLESHTYDSNGRGLTSSRAAGVDAVTVVYPQ
jgi:YD repeat-containing protein